MRNGHLQPSRQWRCKISAQCPATNTHPLLVPTWGVQSTHLRSQESGGSAAAPETAVVGNDPASAALCRDRYDASRHMASPSHPLHPLHGIPLLYSLATNPTDTLRPSYISNGEGVVGVRYPGPPEYPLWTLDTAFVCQQGRSRGPQQPFTQPTQIYCTATNHHGSTRRRGNARESENQAKLAGSPPTNEPTSNRTPSAIGLLVPRRPRVPRRPMLTPLCFSSGTAGWGPVEDYFLGL
ncbi:hypothetical protein QBC39DRAFT_25842 [Podospora conica]|nr:hypothetical protein QBC39DRAFT_25842 [Schizothecium conicum]